MAKSAPQSLLLWLPTLLFIEDRVLFIVQKNTASNKLNKLEQPT
jgi:hypothetical protein